MRNPFIVLLLLILSGPSAYAFMAAEEGCGTGRCRDCHMLSKTDAQQIFQGIQGEIVSVDFAEVPGLWEIEMKVQEKKVPLYLDFSKSYLISGNVIRLNDKTNLTEERYRELNKVDLSHIPIDDALLLGNPEAPNRIIVFTDPHCPYCVKLHEVMKTAVANRSDLLFLIKLMPIKQSSKAIAESIVCSQSLEQLEAAFAKQEIPVTRCENKIIEQNLAIAKALGIRSTPTLILPNGQIAPGYKPLSALLELIDKSITKQKETLHEDP